MCLMPPDHITAGAYNWNIDKCLVRHMVWLRKIKLYLNVSSKYCHITTNTEVRIQKITVKDLGF